MNKITHSHNNVDANNLIPKNADTLQILQKRADYFSKPKIQEDKLSFPIKYVQLRLGENEQYGIPYQYVKEAMKNISITILPGISDYILGVMNRRSSLITVLDFKKIFHIPCKEELSKENYIIIVNANNTTVGLLVDDITGSNIYDKTTLNTSIVSEGIQNSSYILGLHNSTISIINLEAVLADLKIKRINL